MLDSPRGVPQSLHQPLGRSKAARYPPCFSCKEHSGKASNLPHAREGSSLTLAWQESVLLSALRDDGRRCAPTPSQKANAFLNHFSVIMKLSTQAEHTRPFRCSQNFFLKFVAAEWHHKLQANPQVFSVGAGEALTSVHPHWSFTNPVKIILCCFFLMTM